MDEETFETNILFCSEILSSTTNWIVSNKTLKSNDHLVLLFFDDTRRKTSLAASKRPRHSGSEIVFTPFSNNGAKTGINGSTSSAFLTNFAIFSVITAHLRRMAVFLSLKPRFNKGTVIDNADAVTV